VKILDRWPYSTDATFVSAPAGSARVKPYQIVVAVSVSLQALLEWDPRTPRFPAILDTGNNHNLSISRGHLLRWAGLQPEALQVIGTIRERQQRIPLHRGWDGLARTQRSHTTGRGGRDRESWRLCLLRLAN
jgi:hypothetical protein